MYRAHGYYYLTDWSFSHFRTIHTKLYLEICQYKWSKIILQHYMNGKEISQSEIEYWYNTSLKDVFILQLESLSFNKWTTLFLSMATVQEGESILIMKLLNVKFIPAWMLPTQRWLQLIVYIDPIYNVMVCNNPKLSNVVFRNGSRSFTAAVLPQGLYLVRALKPVKYIFKKEQAA